ncbi:Rieske (2Fe-2S) protein [Williamsia sp. MIQD14]|uniref:Rieske (2Fe-2S) protein n=1 Tax=Williamsia sp. MIQD14 TaxID=3425703 RepID=UPI003DA04C1F
MTADTADGVGTTGAATYVPVGSISDLTHGEGRAYAVDGVQIAVFRVGGDEVRATAAVCPHRGGPIADGQVDGAKVMCPLHQFTYAFADGACSDPSIGSLPVYPARVVDGVVEVAL